METARHTLLASTYRAMITFSLMSRNMKGYLQVATVKDPSGKLAGVLAVAGAAVRVPVSLLPAVLQYTNVFFGIVAAVMGVAYLALSVQFLRQGQDDTARKILWASFLYLPAILVTLLLTT